ncbi:hypothetical protein [Streptomyces lacrimifluminis]|uniref:hypothetical protein n=1 Tax=Streptomyces lacrimifluminis TaxID=1500077 RepID=UPI00166751E1|nr:hypothetical protein [Streptomyces lacrimifluminis]
MEVQPYTLRGLFEKLGVADSLWFVQEYDLYRAVDALKDDFPSNRARVERFFALARDVTEPSRHTTSTPGCSRSQTRSAA